MKNKKTLVLGATTNPERYAYKAIEKLTEKGHAVLAIGQKTGEVAGVKIHTKTIPGGFKTLMQHLVFLVMLKVINLVYNSDILFCLFQFPSYG
jgi:hypothetical protein